AVGSSCVAFACLNVGSSSPTTNRATVLSDLMGGGTGGHRRGDGLSGVDTYMSNVGLMPAEATETSYRIRILRTELIPGSQGRGERNGGLGIRREYQILDEPQRVTYYTEQSDPAFSPCGTHGGTPGSPSRVTIFDPAGNDIGAPMKGTVLLQ